MIAEQNGRRESGSSGGGGRYGFPELLENGRAHAFAREAVRAQLAAKMQGTALTVNDVKSVLSSYRQAANDSMMGALHALSRRLETEPIPELFDEPIATWLPGTAVRDRGIEVNQLLDYALAGAIRKTPDLSAARLWRWLANVRRDDWSELKDQTKNALAAWLALDGEREAALFEAALSGDDTTAGPWMVSFKYIRATGKSVSPAIVEHVLAKLPSITTKVGRKRLLAIAVDLARSQQNVAAYWKTFDCVDQEPACKALLKQLTITKIDKWRRQDQTHKANALRRRAKETAQNIQTMAPSLTAIRSGGRPDLLDWAAQNYFADRRGDSDKPAGTQRIAHYTNEETTEAIVSGWKYLATNGLGGIDAPQLGKAEAEGRRYSLIRPVRSGTRNLESLRRSRGISRSIIPVVAFFALMR